MAVKIFICYAHEDEALLKKLKKHLRPLQRQGLIDVWHDRNISTGTEWEKEVDKHLNTAQIILLLVSPDFMDSDYCYSIEMKQAIARHISGEAVVIPIILRPVYWQAAPFGKLQALPTDAIHVTSPKWHNLDEAFYNVAEGIRSTIEITTSHRAEEVQGRQAEEELSRIATEKLAPKAVRVRTPRARQKQFQKAQSYRQYAKKLEELIEGTDAEDISFQEVELQLSDTWAMFVSRMASKFDTLEHIKENPDRESSFYHSSRSGNLSYEITFSGRKRGVPFEIHTDVIQKWLLPLAVDVAGEDAGIPWDTALWSVKNESDEEMKIKDPLADCRDCTYWVLFANLKERFEN